MRRTNKGRWRARKTESANLFSQGLSLATIGKTSEAAEALSRALLLDPGSAEGHNNLGLVFQQLGKLDAAADSFQRAVIARPTYALAYSNLAASLIAMGKPQEALRACEEALLSEPKLVSALTNAGAALAALGRTSEAIEQFSVALSIDPSLFEARLGLAAGLRDVQKLEEAVENFYAVLNVAPEDTRASLQLAALLMCMDRHDEALSHYEQVTTRTSASAEAWLGQGRALQEVGRIAKARECFRHAITAEPNNFRCYLSLANSTRLDAEDPALKAMLSMVNNINDLPTFEQINAHFALGKALSDIGQQEAGFEHILKGNELRRSTFEYHERKSLGALQHIKDRITPEYLQRWPPGCNSEAPIFIVGMPRSGSTLVEQILAAHPDVVCAGESSAFREALKAHGFDPIGRTREPLRIPTNQEAQRIADSYLQLVRSPLEPTSVAMSTRITDKMLNNFRYIGLISRLFPRARIIHTFRDPIESCLSAFRINFDAQPFAFNLGELGRYYRAYAILMRHWRQALPPGTIFDVRYEAVAHDLETSARAIIEYCGLKWNNSCLRFHEVDRPVKTASVEQVRRPIYQSSIRTSRPSAETLFPLLEGLNILNNNDR